MKIVTAIAATAALLPALLSAQESTEGGALSVSSSIGYESKYVNMGTQYAEAIFVPTVNVGYKDFYTGLWMGAPVEKSNLYVTEADLYAGWRHELSETFSLDLGATRYAYDAIVDDFLNRDNSLEFYVGLSANLPLSPSLYIYRDIDCNQNTFELSASHLIGLTQRTDINLAAAVGYISNDAVDYVYYSANADFEYAFTEKTTGFAGVRAGGSDQDRIFGDANDTKARNSAVWFGFGMRTNF